MDLKHTFKIEISDFTWQEIMFAPGKHEIEVENFYITFMPFDMMYPNNNQSNESEQP